MTGSPPTARRVLIVSNLFPPHVLGGAELVAYRQARRLQARGHTVSVFAGWMAPADQADRLAVEDQDGLRVWRTSLASFAADDGFFVPAVAARLQSVLTAEQPDLVHFHNLNGLGFSLIPSARRHGLPVIVTLHDHAGYCYRATALRPGDSLCPEPEECALACQGTIRLRDRDIALPMRLRRDYVAWALAHADRLISPSNSLACSYVAAGVADAARIDVISNGIDLDPFRAIVRQGGDGRLRFTSIAYLGEHKGILDLLHAAALLARQADLVGKWSLTIAGDGHLRPEVEAQIASGRFADAVTYLGRVARDRIVAELATTDVLVLPSRWPENEPVVLLEAIAAGVAQLATATGGMPDLVQQGTTGDLVPPSDPEAMASAMAGYIREPDRARRQGEANKARRERFSEEAAMVAIEAAYEAVVWTPRAPKVGGPLVLCAGERPVPQAVSICDHLYRLEQPCPGARLVWHEWADAADWEQAVLLWNWSSAASHVAIQRALRCGVPVIAPSSCAEVSAMEKRGAAALTYKSYLEGMLMLARLPHDSVTLRAIRRGGGEAPCGATRPAAGVSPALLSLRWRLGEEAAALIGLRQEFVQTINAQISVDDLAHG